MYLLCVVSATITWKLAFYFEVVLSFTDLRKQNAIDILRRPRPCETTRHCLQNGEDTRDDTGAVEGQENYRFNHTSRYGTLMRGARSLLLKHNKILENQSLCLSGCQVSFCRIW